MTKQELENNMQEVIEGCMGTAQPGCVATCPMHTDVKKYVQLIGEGQGGEAIRVIREKLFMPGVLGRICAHPCESKCKWNEAHNPIAIASLKRYAADHFDDEAKWDLKIEEEKGKSVAVIGAGPAGAQAALDLRKKGFKVDLYEKLNVVGGMMRVGIPEYRLPRTVIDHEYSYLTKLGVNFKLGMALGKDVSLDELKAQYDAIIIAIGKHVGRIDTSLENHQAKGIYSAARFLKEAALTKSVEGVGKHVLVIGGGDVAMDCARVATRLPGVRSVKDICLESSFEAMFASDHEIHGAQQEGITFGHATAIKEILVDHTNRVCGVVTKKCLGMFDEEGRFSPSFDEEDSEVLEIDTIVFAIGQMADTQFADNKLTVKPNSTFECDPVTLQSIDDQKLFFAGDVSGQSVIVIQAMATGRRAAESVSRFLEGESLVDGRHLEDTSSYETKLKRELDWDTIEKVQRQDTSLKKMTTLEGNFEEVDLGFDEKTAKKEASRCLQCACKLCMKECMMMPEYTDCPKTLFEDYLKTGIYDMDKMIAYSCNECSQCTIACPKDFDLKEIFIQLKKDYAKKNNGLAAIDEHGIYEQFQERECSNEYCVTVPTTTEPKPKKYLFVPGCTVPAYNPEGVEKILQHLRDKLDGEVGTMLRCCGKVSLMMGQEDKFNERYQMAQHEIDEAEADAIVTICPSCYKIYSKYGDKPVISYWELMQQQIGLPESAVQIGKTSDVVFNINDPCATRDVTVHHEAIRWMMDEMGYKVEEMNRNRENTRCCGVGGMACTSNPEQYQRIMDRRLGDCTQDQVVTYCGSCRGTFEAMGKDALHIIDLLFGNSVYTKSQAKKRAAEDIWANRLDTKKRFEKYQK